MVGGQLLVGGATAYSLFCNENKYVDCTEAQESGSDCQDRLLNLHDHYLDPSEGPRAREQMWWSSGFSPVEDAFSTNCTGMK